MTYCLTRKGYKDFSLLQTEEHGSSQPDTIILEDDELAHLSVTIEAELFFREVDSVGKADKNTPTRPVGTDPGPH